MHSIQPNDLMRITTKIITNSLAQELLPRRHNTAALSFPFRLLPGFWGHIFGYPSDRTYSHPRPPFGLMEMGTKFARWWGGGGLLVDCWKMSFSFGILLSLPFAANFKTVSSHLGICFPSSYPSTFDGHRFWMFFAFFGMASCHCIL